MPLNVPETTNTNARRQLGVDYGFTPEQISELERISAEIKAGGKTYSMAEVQEHFESRRKAWLADHAT
jgi:hypothetical protein